jgi:maleate isomerase
VTFTSWRGTVGLINPRRSTRSMLDLIRLMPDGIGFVPSSLNITGHEEKDYRAALPAYHRKIAELSAQGLDLIHPEGAPPFMVDGFAGERRLIDLWEKEFKLPIFTTGMTQLAAMKALGIKKFMGVTPHVGHMSGVFAQYFADAGFKVLSMVRPIPSGISAKSLSREQIYAYTKKAFLAQKGGPQAIFAQSSEFRVIDVIEELEQDLGVPVLSPTVVRCWYIQKKLRIRQPRRGMGQLLAEFP